MPIRIAAVALAAVFGLLAAPVAVQAQPPPPGLQLSSDTRLFRFAGRRRKP